MQCGARVGLDEFDAISEREILGRYPYALAAFADPHASLGNLEEARGISPSRTRKSVVACAAALLRRKRAALER